MKARFLAAIGICILALSTTTTYAVVLPLEGRLPATVNGTDYQAYYDPNLNITWAADANAVGYDANTWATQVAWAANLTIGGIGGWRLPSANVNSDYTVVNCFGGGVTGCADNEFGYLYWEEGITPSTPGPFSNVLSTIYWYGTEDIGSPNLAYTLSMSGGDLGGKTRMMASYWHGLSTRAMSARCRCPPESGCLAVVYYA